MQRTLHWHERRPCAAGLVPRGFCHKPVFAWSERTVAKLFGVVRAAAGLWPQARPSAQTELFTSLREIDAWLGELQKLEIPLRDDLIVNPGRVERLRSLK